MRPDAYAETIAPFSSVTRYLLSGRTSSTTPSSSSSSSFAKPISPVRAIACIRRQGRCCCRPRLASMRHVEITLHDSSGRCHVTQRMARFVLRSKRALLRTRFRGSGSLGRHPVQCGAELGQRHRRLGARRHFVTARLASGHAGSPAAPLARSGEQGSPDHARAAGYARCEGYRGICTRVCSTSGCETDHSVEHASRRAASAQEARVRRKRQ